MKVTFKKTGLMSLFAMLFFVACQKDTIMNYEGKNEVYFSYADEKYGTNRIDSVFISTGYDTKSDSTIKVRIKIMGMPTDFDRPVHFTLVDSLSTAKLGEDIDLLFEQSYIRANSVYGNVVIKIKKTPKLSDTIMLTTLQVLPNEYFEADYIRIRDEDKPGRKKANRFLVYFDGKNEMPNLWTARLSNFTSMFGIYSRVKFEFMCEVLELDREYFMYDPETEDPATVFNVRISPYSMAWLLIVNRKLNEYEATHGERLMDELGNEVKLGISSIY